MLQAPAVRILLFLYEKGEVRYTDLSKLIPSRGTLSDNLKGLEEEGLIQRKVVPSRPIESYYSLSEKGQEVAKRFNEVQEMMSTTFNFRKNLKTLDS